MIHDTCPKMTTETFDVNPSVDLWMQKAEGSAKGKEADLYHPQPSLKD